MGRGTAASDPEQPYSTLFFQLHLEEPAREVDVSAEVELVVRRRAVDLDLLRRDRLPRAAEFVAVQHRAGEVEGLRAGRDRVDLGRDRGRAALLALRVGGDLHRAGLAVKLDRGDLDGDRVDGDVTAGGVERILHLRVAARCADSEEERVLVNLRGAVCREVAVLRPFPRIGQCILVGVGNSCTYEGELF